MRTSRVMENNYICITLSLVSKYGVIDKKYINFALENLFYQKLCNYVMKMGAPQISGAL